MAQRQGLAMAGSSHRHGGERSGPWGFGGSAIKPVRPMGRTGDRPGALFGWRGAPPSFFRARDRHLDRPKPARGSVELAPDSRPGLSGIEPSSAAQGGGMRRGGLDIHSGYDQAGKQYSGVKLNGKPAPTIPRREGGNRGRIG